MAQLQPIAVSEAKAAKMLDLSAEEFRELVAAGALPAPVPIGPHSRWLVSRIEAILRGDAARPAEEDFE